MDKTGLSIGIIGGIGLGLMLGSEFSGRYITILGAILLVISIIRSKFGYNLLGDISNKDYDYCKKRMIPW